MDLARILLPQTVIKPHLGHCPFVVWYNDRPHGALNLWEAETPNMAFVRRLWPEVWLGIAAKQFGW